MATIAVIFPPNRLPGVETTVAKISACKRDCDEVVNSFNELLPTLFSVL